MFRIEEGECHEIVVVLNAVFVVYVITSGMFFRSFWGFCICISFMYIISVLNLFKSYPNCRFSPVPQTFEGFSSETPGGWAKSLTQHYWFSYSTTVSFLCFYFLESLGLHINPCSGTNI